MSVLKADDLPRAAQMSSGWPWTEAQPSLAEHCHANIPWPKISVVIPTFNHARYLEEAIRSVLLQNYPNLELIVIDGGSRDGTVDILKRYEPWLAYWESEPDRGQSHAINKGFAKATGDVINWLCSDDMLLPGALLTVGRRFAEAEIDVLVGGARQVRPDQGNRVIDQPAWGWRLKSMPVGVPLCQPSCFYKRSLLRRPGPLDESFHYLMDVELWNYFKSLNARWERTTEFLSIDRFTGTNKTATGGQAIAEEAKRIYRTYSHPLIPLTFWHKWVGLPIRRLRRANLNAAANAAARCGDFFLTALLSPFYRYHPVRAMMCGAFDDLSRQFPTSTLNPSSESALKRNSRRIPGRVSVIIPAFNAEKSLSRCIESVLAQTYSDVEILVINDGSTDRTEAIAANYTGRLTVISQANAGVSAARNRGMELSNGEFLACLDHDDYWDPQFVELCVEFLKSHPDTVAVTVGSDHRTALNDTISVHPAYLAATPRTAIPSEIPSKEFFEFWYEHNHIHLGAVMLRSQTVDQAGGQRPELVLAEDFEYVAYLATFGQWGQIPRVLLHVDGTQVPKGRLYDKFYRRFQRCTTVETWASRIVPRLTEADRPGFSKILGRVATIYIFAHLFVGRDAEAKRMASAYSDQLEGKFGRLWRASLSLGWLSWKPMCVALRLRTRLQYFFADRRMSHRAAH